VAPLLLRFEAERDRFGQATLAIYPLRTWGRDEGSADGAGALVAKLNEAGLFRASAADTDTRLKAEQDPNQLKIVWDTARIRTHHRPPCRMAPSARALPTRGLRESRRGL